MSYENMFPFNGRAIQALKIVEASFNVSVFFDTQLYANLQVVKRSLKAQKRSRHFS